MNPLPEHTPWTDQAIRELQKHWDTPFEVYASIGSTNQRALEWSREGAPDWATVIADEQTAGRGRRGKAWESRAGLGLWMSVLVPAAVDRASALTLCVGLVAASAAESVVPAGPPRRTVQLKWPNDLELEGKKIAGVLCETARPGQVVVGIGFNVLHGESDFGPLDRAATSLKAAWGVELSRISIAVAILRGLRSVHSFAALDPDALAELRARDALAGRVVEGAAVAGVAAGIDRDGALLVNSGGQVRRVVSGPVELSGGL